MDNDNTKPNISKVFQTIVDIIADREGVKITLKAIKRKEDPDEKPT